MCTVASLPASALTGHPSSLTPKHMSDVFDMAPLAATLTQMAKPKRPSHRRGRSTRSERFDVLRDVRHVFQRAFTKSWGPSASFKALARDFFAVAIGLSPGHVIHDSELNQFQSALLAIELSHVINTSQIMFLNDTASSVLVVCNTVSLSHQLDSFHQAETIFVGVDTGSPVTLAVHDLPWVSETVNKLRNVLRSTSDQIIEPSIFGWNEETTARRMCTLRDWLVDAPVCYVLENSPLPDRPIHEHLSEKCWTFAMRLDAHDPENDHMFSSIPVPASIFASESSSVERSPLLADGVNVKHSFTALQDRMQSKLFNALNGNQPAALIWSDVTIVTEA